MVSNVDHLLRYGYEVSVIHDLSSNVVSKHYFDSQIELSDALFTTRQKYDYVFHFAANASILLDVYVNRGELYQDKEKQKSLRWFTWIT